MYVPVGQLLRCGRVNFCSLEDLDFPHTIMNLREEADTFPAGGHACSSESNSCRLLLQRLFSS